MAARKQSSKRKQSSSSRKTASRKKSTSSRSGARKPSDALALLRADHQLVQGLFDQFEKTRSEDRKAALAEQICNELTIHAQIEEEIFYPAAREAIRETDLLDEATVEHASAKELIAQIENGQGEELFDAKVKVLGEYVKHHVKEEQNELFPQVRKSKLDLKELGERLQARKTELMESAGRGGPASSSSGESLSGTRRSGQAAKTVKGQQSEGIVASIARGIGLSRS